MEKEKIPYFVLKLMRFKYDVYYFCNDKFGKGGGGKSLRKRRKTEEML